MKPYTACSLFLATSLALATTAHAAAPPTTADAMMGRVNSGALSIGAVGFEENKGQVRTTAGDPAPFVRYRLAQGNTVLFLMENGIAFQFNKMHYPEGYAELMADPSTSLRAGHDPTKREQLDALRKKVRLETFRMDMHLEGADPNARITTEGRSDDYTQYYTHDALDVHTYTKVIYHDVYPGIDWVVYSTEQGMKYDFVLRPGADPDRIRLRFAHHEELYVDGKGNLVHGNRMGRFIEHRPVSFQGKREVPTQFRLEGKTLRFSLDNYDRSQPLIIDPDRIWGTYYGGTGGDYGNSCTADGGGNVYMAGNTESSAAIASGGHQVVYNRGGGDAFLVKFDADGVRQWATYYGGISLDEGWSCATDGNGNVYLAGTTESHTNVATGGSHSTNLGIPRDAFLVKFNADGVRQWGTYYGSQSFGGSAGHEDGFSCATDGSGNVYLTGITNSTVLIATSGAYQQVHGGGYDAFLVKFDTNGVQQWATYYGGLMNEYGVCCATDGSGNVYIGGRTSSTNAIASGGYQNTFGGGALDAFLVKFDAAGRRQWGTYYGGNGSDRGQSCAVDASGNVYLAGNTQSTVGIASGGHQNALGGGADAFLVKFDAAGQRQWATYYGGMNGTDVGNSCATDDGGNVYLAGWTSASSDIAFGGYQNTFGGGSSDAFLVKFDAAGRRQWGTYYGGANGEGGGSCATDGTGNVYLAGNTRSPSAIAFGGHQNTLGVGGESDAFLAKFQGDIGTSIPSGDLHVPIPLHAWPNPACGILHLSRPVEGQVLDATGRVVHVLRRERNVPLQGMAPGVYLLRTADGMTVRFVRE